MSSTLSTAVPDRHTLRLLSVSQTSGDDHSENTKRSILLFESLFFGKCLKDGS